MQNRWKPAWLIVKDEKSMIGRTQMGKLNRRLWQIYPAMAHKTLRGMAAIMFGDFLQLPPVGDSALFSTKKVLDHMDGSQQRVARLMKVLTNP
jgi:hypothetical protein